MAMVFDRNDNRKVAVLLDAGSMGTAILRRVCAGMTLLNRPHQSAILFLFLTARRLTFSVRFGIIKVKQGSDTALSAKSEFNLSGNRSKNDSQNNCKVYHIQ